MPDLTTLREGVALCQKVLVTLEQANAKKAESEQKKRLAAIQSAVDAGLDVDANAMPEIGGLHAAPHYDLIGRLMTDIQTHIDVIEELTC